MLVNRAREASHTACPEPVEGFAARFVRNIYFMQNVPQVI